MTNAWCAARTPRSSSSEAPKQHAADDADPTPGLPSRLDMPAASLGTANHGTAALAVDARPPALHDRHRLAALRATELLDAPVAEPLDRITRTAARLLGVPTVVISLVDTERQFFAAQVGVVEPWATRRGTPLSHSFCRHVVESGEALVVEHASQHPLVCDNPAIAELGVVAYAGVPLRTTRGHVLGSFCAIDGEPRTWTVDDLATLEDLARAAVEVIELRTAVTALGGATDALRELLDETTELVCAADADGHVTYANRSWLAALGYTLDEAIGLRAVDLVAPEDRARYLDAAHRLHEGERIVEFEAVLLASDGRRVVCRGRAQAEMRDDPTAPNGRRCVATHAAYRDVTAERQAEAARAHLVSLVEATSDIVLTAGPDGRIQYLNRTGRRVLGLADDADVTTRHARDLPTPETLTRLVGEAFPALQRDGAWTGDGVLLAAGGEHIPVSMGIVAHPSLVAGGKPSFTAIVRDLRERAHAEETLRRGKAQLRAVVDHAAVGISIIAPDGTIESANPALHAFLGYDDGTLVGRYAPDFSPAEDAAVSRDAVAALHAGAARSVAIEKRFVRRDGAVRLAELTLALIPLADGRTGLLGLTTDVTERRAAETALVASEARYRTAIEGSLDAFMALQSVRDAAGAVVDFEVIEASTRAAELVQMPREDLIGQYVGELFPLVHAQGHFARFVEVAETRTTLEWEYQPVDPRVVARAVRVQAVPLDDGLAVSLRDVTERWRAENARRESEAFTRRVLEHLSDGVVACDARGRLTLFNRATREFHGVPHEPLPSEAWAEHYALFRDDGVTPLPTAEIPLVRAHRGETVRGAAMVIAARDGTRRAVRASGGPIVGDDGRALGAVVVMHDVTEQTRAEAALRESEARVRGAVEASLDALFILRGVHAPDGALEDFEIAECNGRGAAFARVPREELLGRSATAVFREARRRGLFDACARVAATGEPFSTEHRVEAAAGAPASWAWLQVVRVGDGVAITARDITAQKASEEALREMALVDELTGVYNRRGFLAAAEREWTRVTRERQGALLVYIDLDGFKRINDTYGHAEGDRALRTVGDVMRAAFRGGDVVGRLGGDEFAVLVVPASSAGLSTPAQAAPAPEMVEAMIRERLARHLAAANAEARAAGRPYDLALSVGVAHAPPNGGAASLAALMVDADEQLYEVKHARKARAA